MLYARPSCSSLLKRDILGSVQCCKRLSQPHNREKQDFVPGGAIIVVSKSPSSLRFRVEGQVFQNKAFTSLNRLSSCAGELIYLLYLFLGDRRPCFKQLIHSSHLSMSRKNGAVTPYLRSSRSSRNIPAAQPTPSQALASVFRCDLALSFPLITEW